ncbi:uncharacterized protein ARMOST_13823 [Armillaria ostoyae]|uniref:Uncharacterized protein n=1 Tax=Armillaria ostoyae TaxID=47428 RepID=A0A284RNV0_ARMOS|nr:uncharacterized protein ARMOST_13823 [Armillaria ostoyae]
MVNPGAFRGSQLDFLVQEIEGYIKAVEEGHTAEFIADVVHHYLKRYPLSLAHNVEPLPEHLAAMDDHMPDPEVMMPDKEGLSFVEYEKVQLKFMEDQKNLKFRSEQICRWLRYQYAKQNDMSAKDMGVDNPWTILLHRLMGVGLSKPRKPQAFVVWYKSNTAEVDAAWKAHTETMKDSGCALQSGQHAASFQSFKSKTYNKLLVAEKKSWEDLAVEEHEVAMKEFEEKLNTPVSQEPKDLQSCLEHLPSIVKLLIDIIVEATGCPVSIYVGGPQLADGGHLHIASGKTLGMVKQNFIKAEWVNMKCYILPVYSNFLKRCFTVDMCRARALPSDMPTLESIGFASDGDGVTLHTINGDLYNSAGSKELIATKESTIAATATQSTTTATKKTTTKATKVQEAPVKKSSDVRLERPATNSPVSESNLTLTTPTQASVEKSPPIPALSARILYEMCQLTDLIHASRVSVDRPAYIGYFHSTKIQQLWELNPGP